MTRKRVPSTSPVSRTRSFPCPDDLWADVERFAAERDLGSPAAAARLLLRRGLRVERETRQLDAARAWQAEQAWADMKSIAAGDIETVEWSEIVRLGEQARERATRSRAVPR